MTLVRFANHDCHILRFATGQKPFKVGHLVLSHLLGSLVTTKTLALENRQDLLVVTDCGDICLASRRLIGKRSRGDEKNANRRDEESNRLLHVVHDHVLTRGQIEPFSMSFQGQSDSEFVRYQ